MRINLPPGGSRSDCFALGVEKMTRPQRDVSGERMRRFSQYHSNNNRIHNQTNKHQH